MVLARCQKAVDDALRNAFGKLGDHVTRKPIMTVIICIVASLACGGGLGAMKFETDIGELWYPSNSVAERDQKRFWDAFPSSSFLQDRQHATEHFVTVVLPGEILTKRALGAVWQVHEQVGGSASGCNPNACLVAGIVSLWPSRVAFESDGLWAAKVHDYVCNQTQTGVPRWEVGGLTGCPSNPVADGLRLYYDTADIDAFQELAEDVDVEDLEVTYWVSDAMDRELDRAITADLPLVPIACILMVIYVMAAIGSPSIGLGAVASVILATIAGFGIASAAQVPFSNMTAIVPFLLLGIGVDDSFIISRACRTGATEHLLPQPRVAMALSLSGSSVLMTTLTDLVAFGGTLGAPVAALRQFATFLSLGVLADFILQVTFFPCLLAIDFGRTSKSPPPPSAQYTPPQGVELPTVTPVDNMHNGMGTPQLPPAAPKPMVASKPEPTSRCAAWSDAAFAMYQTRFIPAMLSVAGSVCVCVVSLALWGVMSWAASNVRVGQQVDDFAPQGSFLVAEAKTQDEFFLGPVGSQFYVTVLGVDLCDVQVRDKIRTLTQNIANSGELAKGTQMHSWLDEWAAWRTQTSNCSMAESEMDCATFLICLSQFLLENPMWADDLTVVRGESYSSATAFIGATHSDIVSAEIWASRVYGYHKPSKQRDGDAGKAFSVQKLRDVCDDSDLEAGDGKPFPFGQDYEDLERFLGFGPAMVQSLSTAAAACAAVAFLILWNPVGVLLVLLMVTGTVVVLLGSMSLFGIMANESSIVAIVLSVGFAIDYCAHVAHAFLARTGSRRERVETALAEVGVAVFHGGTTAILAAIPMAFGSPLFGVFSRTFLVISLAGLWHGLVLLPVILNRIGPQSHSQDKVEPRETATEERAGAAAA